MARFQKDVMTVAFLAIVVNCLLMITTTVAGPQISIKNNCGYDIWIGQMGNNGHSALPGNGLGAGDRLSSGGVVNYGIPDRGWGGRFWPKVGCDSNGNSCESGSSINGCPPDGCQPPAETKVEFFYHPLSDTVNTPFYDISLVDGYSIPMKISPSVTDGGSCVETSCGVSLDRCPQNEIDQLGDLRVVRNGKTVMCLSPCKKWNYPSPYGFGRPEVQDPGVQMCCPVSAGWKLEQCRAGDVVKTEYVNIVRQQCPTAYSYAYDDHAGLHNCPPGTSFSVTVCP